MPKRSAGEPHGSRERGESLWANFYGAVHWGFGTRDKSKGEWHGERAKEARITGRVFMGAIYLGDAWGCGVIRALLMVNSPNTNTFRL